MAKAIFAYDAMAAERVLGSSLKLLAFLFTVVFIIQDNVITFRKQDPIVPQTVSTSLEVLGLASHSTLRPNGRFKSRARRFSKCLQMSRPTFQYYLDRPDIEWTRPTCVRPPLSDSFFAGLSEGELAEINVPESDREKVTQEDDAERSFGDEDEDIIYGNVQLELLTKTP